MANYIDLPLATTAAINPSQFGNQIAGTFLSGPSSGVTSPPTFRAIIPSFDIPSSGFSARYFTSTGVISGAFGSVVYLTKAWDDNGSYNSGTGVFTVPSSGAGTYQVSAGLIVGGTIALNSTLDMQMTQAGSRNQTSEQKQFAAGAQTDLSVYMSDIFRCAVGDTISVKALSSITGPSIAASSSQNYISVARIG